MPAINFRLSIAVASLAMLLLSASPAFAGSEKPTVTVDDVVKAWEARANKVKTLRLKWTERYVLKRGEFLLPHAGFDPDNPRGLVVPEVPGIFNKVFSLVMDGDKIRYQKIDVTMSPEKRLVSQESLCVFVGEEYRKLFYPGVEPFLKGYVTQEIHFGLGAGPELNLAPLLITYRPFHPTISTLQNFKKRFRVVAGKHVVEGRDCVLLKDQPRGPAQLSMSLFLDPERDFLVMSELVEARGAEASRSTFLEYEQHDENWLPVRWMTTFGQKAGAASRTNAPCVTEFALGEKIDPREFELEFPPGTLVSESGCPTNYIVKEGGTRRTITEEESFVGRYEDFLSTETGALAKGPDTTDNPAARRKKMADIRRYQVRALRGWGVWNCLVVRNDGVEVRIELVGESLDPDRPMQIVICKESCDQMLFGKAGNEEAARDALANHLLRNIEAVDRICRLTDAQKQKLELAGRGDFNRYFQNVGELRSRVLMPLDESEVNKGALDDMVTELLRETRPLRRMVNAGTFDSSSLFAKTLKSTLTSEQAAAYVAAQLKLKPSENP